jgi:hypothetical protein
VNLAYILQSGLSGGNAYIDQFGDTSGNNKIATYELADFQYHTGFEQKGVNSVAYIYQTTDGANNYIEKLKQLSGYLSIKQGLNYSDGGASTISSVDVDGSLTVTQNTSGGGSNLLKNFLGGGIASNIEQEAAGSAINTIGGCCSSVEVRNNSFKIFQSATGTGVNNFATSSGLSATGGDAEIHQLSEGANYSVDITTMYQGTLKITQNWATIGSGSVFIDNFSGGTVSINQIAASNGGINAITVNSMTDSTGSLFISQGGGDNTAKYSGENGGPSHNNIFDDGTVNYVQGGNIAFSKYTIEQDGTGNGANLNQKTSDNIARLYQAGTQNTATINQFIGSGNTAFIVQLGSNSTAIISQ